MLQLTSEKQYQLLSQNGINTPEIKLIIILIFQLDFPDLLVYILQKMESDSSQFKDSFTYPDLNKIFEQKRRYQRSQKSRSRMNESNFDNKQNFYDIVLKTKNVALFASKLKQKVAQNQTLTAHTLKPHQLSFLENDSRQQSSIAYFNHDSNFVFISSIVFIVVLMVYIWNCTFDLVFGQFFSSSIIAFITACTYVLHIIIFLSTQYKNQREEIINSANQIKNIYFKDKMFRDGIAIFSLVAQIFAGQQPQIMVILRIISILVIWELSEVISKIQNLLSISLQLQSIISLAKMLCKIFIFLHCLSLIFNFIAKVEQQSKNPISWLNSTSISSNSKSTSLNRYILGWYWGATILSTVGFGDITPQTNLQRFIISIVQVTCCLGFGYFLNGIGALIKVRYEVDENYEKQTRSLNRFLRSMAISYDLKHKIRTFYLNKHIVEKMHDQKEQKMVLETIQPNLKNLIQQDNNIKYLKRCNQLQVFSSETIRIMAQALRRMIFAPQQILYSRNTNDLRLWIIQKGTIQQTTDLQNSKLKRAIFVYNEKQPLVGWINMILQTAYKTMAKIKVFTVTYEMDEQTFLNIITTNLKDYYKFLELKHKAIEKKKKYIGKCISCGRYTHNVIDCPRIHLIKSNGQKLIRNNRLKHQDIQKKHKVQRNFLTLKWKSFFGNGDDQKVAKLFNNIQNLKLQNTTFQNFFQKPSIEGFQNKEYSKRKNSIMMLARKSSRMDYLQARLNNSSDKSYSGDYENVETQKDLFEKVFFNKEGNNYFPRNNIQEIIESYKKFLIKRNEQKINSRAKISKKIKFQLEFQKGL